MIHDIPLPRLLNASGGTERRITPISVSIDLTITPLSYANITLPIGESVPARSYVELYTILGSAGIFRVRSPQDSYGRDMATAELEHAVVEVGDFLVRAKYDEMMTATTAMTTIFSHYRGNKWQLGDISALGSGQVAVEANYDKVLESMLAIMEQKPDCMMTFDFSTTPWTINIVSKGTMVTAEGRLSRNVNAAKIVYDDTELCTVAYYERLKEGSATSEQETEWIAMEADTKNLYGTIEREVKTGSNYTADEALRVVNQYIEEHKHPRVSVEVSAEELSKITGESLDAFEVGKLFRLVLVDYDLLPIEKNITGLSFPNVYEQPRNITVLLEQEEDTLITFLHDVDAKGGSGGGGGSRKKQDDEAKRTYTEWINTDKMIGMVVGTIDGEYKIKGGEITLAINEDGGTTAKIQADAIDIQGIVDELMTYDLKTVTLYATNTLTVEGETQFYNGVTCLDGSGLDGGYVDVSDVDTTTLTVDRSEATWRTKQISTPTFGTRRYFLYAAQSGSTTPTGTTYHYPITGHSESTIHYLGGADT